MARRGMAPGLLYIIGLLIVAMVGLLWQSAELDRGHRAEVQRLMGELERRVEEVHSLKQELKRSRAQAEVAERQRESRLEDSEILAVPAQEEVPIDRRMFAPVRATEPEFPPGDYFIEWPPQGIETGQRRW